jgi:hypothetical protein
VPDVREVYADLMRPPRHQTQFEERESFVVPPQYLLVGNGRVTVLHDRSPDLAFLREVDR